MENNFLVSVIVPAYNAESTIRTTLEAILKQSYKNIEVLVVDDGSKDSTAEIVSVYEDCRIVLIRKENGGVSSARNFGIKKARGEWIAFCDADDIWDNLKLEKQIHVINNLPDVDFIGCNRNGEKTRVLFHSYNRVRKIVFSDMLIKTFPQTSTVVIRKTVFNDVGVYDENQKYAEDGNLWLRICKKKNCYMMPESLVCTGNGKPNFGYSGLSANLKAMSDGVLKNIKEMYSLHYITAFTKNILIVYEKVKYFRRVFICALRKNR